jgi:c-di-GMP-binding flagellar brake protein YcgR
MTPDTKVAVRFRPARHLPFVEAKGRVRYQLPDRGVGIEFTEISPEQQQKILRLILHRLVKKRGLHRVPFVTQVEYEGGVFLGASRNISAGGMFIEMKGPLLPGYRPRVQFHLDDGGPVIVATAEVKYSVAKLGMGVEFIDLSPADRKRIGDYIAKEES